MHAWHVRGRDGDDTGEATHFRGDALFRHDERWSRREQVDQTSINSRTTAVKPLLDLINLEKVSTHTRYVAKRAAGPELRRNTKARELKHALKLKELVCVLMLARIRKIRPAAAGRHAGIGPRGGRRVSLTGYLAPP